MSTRKPKQSIPKRKTEPKKDTMASSIEYLKSFLIALVLALIIKATIIEAYKIPTPSMENTLLAGDFILGNKFIYGFRIPYTDIRLPAFQEPKRGDIIIFRPPHSPRENYVKRCVGMPGDTIQLINKRVYINGELFQDSAFTEHRTPYTVPLRHPVDDPYVLAFREYGIKNDGYRTYAPFRDNSDKIIVPENKYFMMGDNRDNSLDSRMWGFIDREDILGRALMIHWSWKMNDNDAPVVDWQNPFTVVANVGYNFFNFYKRVNWERIGRFPQ